MPNQCQQILPESRQQCTRPAYATATIDDVHGQLPFCRLHFSQLMAKPEVFVRESKVLCDADRANFNSLMQFFKRVHMESQTKEL